MPLEPRPGLVVEDAQVNCAGRAHVKEQSPELSTELEGGVEAEERNGGSENDRAMGVPDRADCAGPMLKRVHWRPPLRRCFAPIQI